MLVQFVNPFHCLGLQHKDLLEAFDRQSNRRPMEEAVVALARDWLN